jgi:hypothetical protein
MTNEQADKIIALLSENNALCQRTVEISERCGKDNADMHARYRERMQRDEQRDTEHDAQRKAMIEERRAMDAKYAELIDLQIALAAAEKQRQERWAEQDKKRAALNAKSDIPVDSGK